MSIVSETKDKKLPMLQIKPALPSVSNVSGSNPDHTIVRVDRGAG